MPRSPIRHHRAAALVVAAAPDCRLFGSDTVCPFSYAGAAETSTGPAGVTAPRRARSA